MSLGCCFPCHIVSAKVHATKCRDFAASTADELGGRISDHSKRCLKRLGGSSSGNAERDAHRIFRQEELCLPIAPHCRDFAGQPVHYLSLKTWFPFLLGAHPGLLLGGFHRKDWESKLLLRTFWKHFESNCPDHAVFDLHPNRLDKCVPFYLHIDEGTGLRKSAVIVLAMQCPFGRQTSKVFAANHSHATSHSLSDLEKRMTASQCTNSMGSTYLSRFLFTALPKKSYTQKRGYVYWGVLDLLATECQELMEGGVKVRGEEYFPICLGIKGDVPALVKCGAFKRSFMNLGLHRGICYECCAGMKDFPFEDIGQSPAWIGTVGLVPAWVEGEESPLMRIPCQPSLPHMFFKRDPFHCFKQTLGGHFGASTIVLLAVDFSLWKVEGEPADVPSMFDKAFLDFRFWVKHEWRGKVVNHMQGFTRQTLHFADYSKFPYARWKGSDQMLIVRWLRSVILNGVVFEHSMCRDGLSLLHSSTAWQVPYFEAILQVCNAAIAFFHLLHREGIWLSKQTAMDMASHCKKVCSAFSALARLCHQRGIARYHLEPCLHAFRHFAHDLEDCVDRGCEYTQSPGTHTCEMDEDFIGKICTGSKHVHALAMNKRTIDRYLLRCHAEFSKA